MQASCCSQGKAAPLTPIIPNECMASSHQTPSARPGEAAEGSPEQGAAGSGSWSPGAAEEEEEEESLARLLPASARATFPCSQAPCGALSTALLLWERGLTPCFPSFENNCYFPSLMFVVLPCQCSVYSISLKDKASNHTSKLTMDISYIYNIYI